MNCKVSTLSNPVDSTSSHPVPLESQKKTLAEQGIGLDNEAVIKRVVKENMPGAVSLEQVREETDNDPVLSKVNQLLSDHEQNTLDKVWGMRGYCHPCHTIQLP